MKKLVLTTLLAAMVAPVAFAAPKHIELSDVDLGSYSSVHAMDSYLEQARSPMGAAAGLDENDFEFMMVFVNDAGENLYAPSSRKGAVKFKPTKHPRGYGDFELDGARKWDTMDNVWRAAHRAGYTFVGTVDRPNK